MSGKGGHHTGHVDGECRYRKHALSVHHCVVDVPVEVLLSDQIDYARIEQCIANRTLQSGLGGGGERSALFFCYSHDHGVLPLPHLEKEDVLGLVLLDNVQELDARGVIDVVDRTPIEDHNTCARMDRSKMQIPSSDEMRDEYPYRRGF